MLLLFKISGLLKKSGPSRIVFTSSWLAFTNNLTEANLNEPKSFFTYSNSKACNVISADGFAKRLKGTNVTTYSVHPGVVNTKIFGQINNQKSNEAYVTIISNLLYSTILPIYGKVRTY